MVEEERSLETTWYWTHREEELLKKNKQIKENIQKLQNKLKKSKKYIHTTEIPEKNREKMGNKKYLKW